MEHISENGMHEVYDADPHFSIDPDTRVLTYESPEKLTLIQGDHNSQIFTFEIPRFVDGHDMSLCNSVQAHYVNISADNSDNRSSGLCKLTDLQIHPDDDQLVVFSWPVSSNATKYAGSLNFIIRLACVDGSKTTYVWNTAVYTGVTVSIGLNSSETVIDGQADILEEWYWNLVMAGTTGINAIEDAKETAVNDLNAEKQKAIDELTSILNTYGYIECSDKEPVNPLTVAWFNISDSTLRIRNSTTGEWESVNVLQGDINYITNELGNNENLVLSQKRVTEFIQDFAKDVQGIYSRLNDSDYKISKCESLIDDYKADVDKLDKRFTNLYKEYKNEFLNLSFDTQKNIQLLAGRIDGYDKLITDLNNKVTNYTLLIDRVIDEELSISSLVTRIEALETDDSIASVSTEILALTSNVARIEASHTILAGFWSDFSFSTLPSIQSRIEGSENKIAELENAIIGIPTADALTEFIDTVNDCNMRMADLEDRIRSVEANVNPDVSGLISRVETIEGTLQTHYGNIFDLTGRLDYITLTDPSMNGPDRTPFLDDTRGEVSLEAHLTALWVNAEYLWKDVNSLLSRVSALEKAS